MSIRRRTSYRLLLMRSALARTGRAVGYYWVATRAQLRAVRSSYAVQIFGYRVRVGASATGRLFRRLPRKLTAALGLIAWFLGQLPAYVGRLVEERREDRAELRAERRLVAAQIRAKRAERRNARHAVIAERRARRRAQQAEIKAAATSRPYSLPIPAWISRIEPPERSAIPRRLPVPRRALLAGALTLAAVVPAYSVVTLATGSGDDRDAAPEAVAASAATDTSGDGTAAPGPAAVPAAPADPAAPAPVVSGDTGEFVRTLPALPTATPTIPAPRVRVSTPDGAQFVEVPTVGSLSSPLTPEQHRAVKRQARWQAEVVRGEKPYVGKGK